MKQAGTEAKASMKTGEIFLQQQLSEQLGKKGTQFAAPPNIGGGTATAAPADPGLEKARKGSAGVYGSRQQDAKGASL